MASTSGGPTGAELTFIQIGVGTRGATHLRTFTRAPGWRPVALVDISAEYLAAARALTGLPENVCFTTLPAALEAVPSDAVVISTSARFHAEHILQALGAGRHVFVEKPFTVGREGAEEAVALADQRGLRLMVVQNDRYSPQNKTLHRLVQSGDYGPPGFATMVHHKARGGPYPPSVHMHLWQQGVHQLDTLTWVLGARPRRVRASSVNPVWSTWPSEAFVQALIEYERPDGSRVHATYVGTSDARATDFSFRVECARAALVWQRDGVQVATRAGAEPAALEPREEPSNEHTLAMQFHAYITRGEDPPTSGRRNLVVMRLLDAIVRATESGGTVEVAREA